MGSIFSRHRSAVDELEAIVLQVNKLHSRSSQLQNYRYNFLWWLTVLVLFISSSYSGVICLNDAQPRYQYVVLIWIAGAIVLFALRFVLVHLFDFIIRRNEANIQSLNTKRSKIIENVKENEKFKVAKEIIAKYGGPEDLNEIALEKGKNTPVKAKVIQTRNVENNVPSTPGPSSRAHTLPPNATPHNDQSDQSVAISRRPAGIGTANQAFVTPMFRRQPIRPYIQPHRTPIDKIIDFIVGDGPSNRFALICRQCSTHNGMVLREEYQSISYICFNCGLFNPARNSELFNAKRSNHLFLTDQPMTTPTIRTATNSESSENESEDDTVKIDEKSSDQVDSTKTEIQT
jgi:hypothetical protein